MPDTITVGGMIATEPKHVTTGEGLNITSFRLASQQRRYDRGQSKWVDAETNWFTVTAFRQLAENAHKSLHKGERVLVRGRLRVRDWTSGERSGITVEIEADGIGHDLAWGRSEFRRTVRAAAAPSGAEAEPGGAEAGAPAVLADDAEPAEQEDALLAAVPF